MITVGMIYVDVDWFDCLFLLEEAIVAVVEVVVCVHIFEKKLTVYIVSKLSLLIKCDKRYL